MSWSKDRPTPHSLRSSDGRSLWSVGASCPRTPVHRRSAPTAPPVDRKLLRISGHSAYAGANPLGLRMGRTAAGQRPAATAGVEAARNEVESIRAEEGLEDVEQPVPRSLGRMDSREPARLPRSDARVSIRRIQERRFPEGLRRGLRPLVRLRRCRTHTLRPTGKLRGCRPRTAAAPRLPRCHM
jgi:hypothetical protein